MMAMSGTSAQTRGLWAATADATCAAGTAWEATGRTRAIRREKIGRFMRRAVEHPGPAVKASRNAGGDTASPGLRGAWHGWGRPRRPPRQYKLQQPCAILWNEPRGRARPMVSQGRSG